MNGPNDDALLLTFKVARREAAYLWEPEDGDIDNYVIAAGCRAVWDTAIDAATNLAFKRKGGYETGIDLIELRTRESLNSGKDD